MTVFDALKESAIARGVGGRLVSQDGAGCPRQWWILRQKPRLTVIRVANPGRSPKSMRLEMYLNSIPRL